MSWMQKLYQTYERCAGREPEGVERLAPIAHTTQQAHIEIVIDGDGRFRRASVLLDKDDSTTIIPCTEESGGRAGSKPVNHPLCDKLQYVAGDYLAFGGKVTSGFEGKAEEPHQSFVASLRAWAGSRHSHPKVESILRYVEQGHPVSDLVDAGILPVDADGNLLRVWTGDKGHVPAIFKAVPNTQSPQEAFVRWRVEEIGNVTSGTWDDEALISSWVSYYEGVRTKRGYCMVTGKETPLAAQHPAKLRHGGDKAKLISSNDTSGYTFRGRFLEAHEAVTVGYEVTQKAHNALRWLVRNQAFRSGDPVIVSWAVPGTPLPSLFDNTLELLGYEVDAMEASSEPTDTAQSFALRLARAIGRAHVWVRLPGSADQLRRRRCDDDLRRRRQPDSEDRWWSD